MAARCRPSSRCPRERRRPGKTPAVLLAHGAGADMRSPFMSTVHAGLAREGYVVAQVQLPLHRGAAAAARPAARARALLAERRSTPSAATARSRRRGSRSAASRWAAAWRRTSPPPARPYARSSSSAIRCTPPASPTQLRADHLPAIQAPMLFVQGTRDALCDLDRLRGVLAEAAARDAAHHRGRRPLLPPAAPGREDRRRGVDGDRDRRRALAAHGRGLTSRYSGSGTRRPSARW